LSRGKHGMKTFATSSVVIRLNRNYFGGKREENIFRETSRISKYFVFDQFRNAIRNVYAISTEAYERA